MKRILLLVWLMGVALAAAPLRLATTTSVNDSGLLDALLPGFTQETGIPVQVIAVGTGQALAIAGRGDADAVLVHAPDLEARFLHEGQGVAHACIAYNNFVIAGPTADPARVGAAADALDAMRRIYAAGAPFVSRGDNSGTYHRERALWEAAGLRPDGQPWYLESGSGMGATLSLAAEKRAYTLTDLGTYLFMKDKVELADLYDHPDPLMLNQYGYMVVNPERFEHVNAEAAYALRAYLLRPDVQQRIGAYMKDRFGKSLFNPLYGRCKVEVRP
ncbi:substrate-binding domain-containing protein [Oceanithermus sp.]|uniref:substrate-binding domain-containing protein n=1 Tax=Oceanithermus sp. TaxID=2268145 RepID=UPI002600A3F6|nr:substrate-binding domain-containing protein [Oceanithermus sp.]